VMNVSLVEDATIRLLGFHIPQRQWSLMNHFLTGPMGGTRIFEVAGQRGGKAEGIGGQTKIVIIGLLTDEN